MKAIKSMKYVAVMIIALCAFSCDGEDGNDGLDGMDGTNGTQGVAGEDGNANVMGRTIDPFPDWEPGLYLGADANTVTIDEPMLDEATTADALVLMYFQVFGQNIWHPMTFSFPLNDNSNQVLTFTYSPETIVIYSLSSSGPLDALVSKARYFIIPTEGSSGRSQASNLENLRLDLAIEGVDIDSYEEVENYYNK